MPYFALFPFSKLDIPRLALVCRATLRLARRRTRQQIRNFLLFATARLRRLRRRLRRRTRQQALRFLLIATVRVRRLRVWSQAQIAKVRFVARALIPALLVLAIGGVVFRHRVQWQKASEALGNKGILPELEIAVGAAMLGVIGIVFSLSIFSIQQAAERGTTLTLREYARDWVFRVVYWSLALFASLEMLSALQKNESGLYRACLTLGILGVTFLMLKVYFDRAMKFLDPHFTITKVAKRATKLLRRIQRIERAVQSEVRYQRSRKHT
jgi:uncharacterized membrane protein